MPTMYHPRANQTNSYDSQGNTQQITYLYDMNIINQIEAAMSKLLAETGLDANCITLHPEHHAQLINEFKDMVNVDPDVEEPIWYKGIPVYKAENEDASARNHLLEKGFSIVGHYDFREDYYVHEQHFPLVSQ